MSSSGPYATLETSTSEQVETASDFMARHVQTLKPWRPPYTILLVFQTTLKLRKRRTQAMKRTQRSAYTNHLTRQMFLNSLSSL